MSWRSPRSPKRTGRRSGRTTPSSGSTRRSSAEPMSWRSSPTPQRSCGWQPPWSSNPTTNGRSPAAISPMSPWTHYAPSSPQNTRPQHWTNNTKSPSVQQDSLITMRKPRQDPKSTNSRDAIHSGGIPVDRSTSDVNRDDMVLRPSRRPPDTERDPTNGGPVKLLYVSQGRHRLIDDDALFGDASERVVSPQNLCSF